MKAIVKCKVCGGKIIQAGNGNIFCEDCTDKNFGQRLQEWADIKEKQRIVRRALDSSSDGVAVCPACYGAGVVPGDINGCYHCGGTGKQTVL
jgi:RecJ-like exonuclease